jgi:hypothetical protein
LHKKQSKQKNKLMTETFPMPSKGENFDYDLMPKDPDSFFYYHYLPLEINFLQPYLGNRDRIDFENMKNIIFDKSEPNIIEENNIENNDLIYFNKDQKYFNNDESKSTDNTINNITQIQNKEIEKENEILDKKKINFLTFLGKKRGKKASKANSDLSKKYHNSEDFDNLQRKIQVHYINFLLSLANDIIINFFGKKKNLMFKDIRYDLKKIVNHEKVEYLKQCKFKDIIQSDISPKNKKFSKDTNKNIYSYICKLSRELKNIFDLGYLFIFQKFYLLLNQIEKVINIENIKINLSPKTKSFCYLLKKNEKSNEKFIEVIKNVYLSDVNYLSDKKFLIC